jgi:site-specific DNA-methyltransferase (adenine-specific)
MKNEIILGNAFEVIKDIPDNSVDCMVTSSPYWQQRYYGTEPIILGGLKTCNHDWLVCKGSSMNPDTNLTGRGYKTYHYNQCSKCNAYFGEFGQEPSPEMFVEHYLILLREIKRTLKDTGTMWIEIGEKYYNSSHPMGSSQANVPELLKIAICHKLFMYCRNTIILFRIPSRPESLKTRFSKKYAFLYMFTKAPSKDHYFDLESVKIPAKNGSLKNPGDVWITHSTKLKGSNTASYSTDMVERVILSGCPEGGTVLDPFAGIGTSCYMAKKLGRNYIGIEYLKENYDKCNKLMETL